MANYLSAAIANGAAGNSTIVNAELDKLGNALELQGGGAAATATVLKAWAEAGAYELTTPINLDSDDVITTATVKWPDGGTGTFTTTTKNSTWLAVDAYTITHTHTAVTLTVTQAAVTRNSNGTVTTKPELTVA